ncbi:hypothetical protein JXA27_06955 [Aerococcaceae bacterium zg-B36]|uniref:CD1375 family protein n=1 Tax=Aerococcaceae bacterium zg-252 TaxID=2796928 RepID=UPI001BD7FF0C|nr:hypothetical protein [Aerococcaceae bacterium zg-B36]
MTEQARQKFSTLIGMYVELVLNGERKIEEVPALIREAVREDTSDLDKLANMYVQRRLAGNLLASLVPKVLQERVEKEVESTVKNSVLIYVADVIDGTKELTDVPSAIRTEVKAEVERHVGKKLD